MLNYKQLCALNNALETNTSKGTATILYNIAINDVLKLASELEDKHDREGNKEASKAIYEFYHLVKELKSRSVQNIEL